MLRVRPVFQALDQPGRPRWASIRRPRKDWRPSRPTTASSGTTSAGRVSPW